ncbi:MAG: hypothetical protein ACRDF7_00070 [Candidatus Limnocylindrales bacterium]
MIFSTIQNALSPFGGAPAGVSNPLALGGAIESDLAFLGAASSLSGIVCLPLIAASLVIRYRRAAGIERAQLRWFVAVAAIIGPAFAIGIVAGALTNDVAVTVANVAYLITFVGLALLPVAIGIAVLRYRLYDIDLIIRRTAVYVPLTAVLAGLYAASIALLQRLFIAATGGPSDGAVILSTLILATTFTPIRAALQGIVDRRFRDAQDAKRLLDAFVDQLSAAAWAPDPARTMRAFLAVSVHALGAAGGVAFAGSAVDERVAGRVRDSSGQPVLVVPVELAGQRIGRVELGARIDRRPYSDRDIEMVHSAGERVAAAIIGLTDIPPTVKPWPESPRPSVVTDVE